MGDLDRKPNFVSFVEEQILFIIELLLLFFLMYICDVMS